jgi:hypothetical protein
VKHCLAILLACMALVTPRASAADDAGTAAPAPPPAETGASVLIATSGQGRVGETVSVTLQNRSGLRASGELLFDAQALQPASAGADAASGRLPFQLPPRGQAVLVLRVLPAAAGQSLALQVGGLRAEGDGGASVDIRLDGEALLQVAAVPAAQSPAQPAAPPAEGQK